MPTDEPTDPTIRIAAALIQDERGRVLLVRKHGTAAFMQPGGKLEPGENAEAALARELREELGCRLHAPRFLGVFSAPAANEPGQRVEAALFASEVLGVVMPSAEIAEVAWINPCAPGPRLLAPLTREYVLPLACKSGPRLPS